MNTHIKYVSAAILLCLFLTACSSGPAGHPLGGTSWSLQSLNRITLGGQAVILEFSYETEVGGSGGCNTFGGSYQADAATSSITFSNIVSTLMACADEDVGEIEAQYFAALNAATNYSLSGAILTITGGVHTLVFVSAP
jgi:heat shock protein HslJ